MKRANFLPRVLLVVALIFAAMVPGVADARSSGWNHGHRPQTTIIGGPPASFSGVVESVDTNRFTVTVKGATANSKTKDAPAGTVTFEISPSTMVKETDGSRGDLSSLGWGAKVRITFRKAMGDRLTANTIVKLGYDTNAAAGMKPEKKSSGDLQKKPAPRRKKK